MPVWNDSFQTGMCRYGGHEEHGRLRILQRVDVKRFVAGGAGFYNMARFVPATLGIKHADRTVPAPYPTPCCLS